MLYAVKNRDTGKYVTGTDFRSGKPRQIMDANRAPLLLDDCGRSAGDREAAAAAGGTGAQAASGRIL